MQQIYQIYEILVDIKGLVARNARSRYTVTL